MKLSPSLSTVLSTAVLCGILGVLSALPAPSHAMPARAHYGPDTSHGQQLLLTRRSDDTAAALERRAQAHPQVVNNPEQNPLLPQSNMDPKFLNRRSASLNDRETSVHQEKMSLQRRLLNGGIDSAPALAANGGTVTRTRAMSRRSLDTAGRRAVLHCSDHPSGQGLPADLFGGPGGTLCPPTQLIM